VGGGGGGGRKSIQGRIMEGVERGEVGHGLGEEEGLELNDARNQHQFRISTTILRYSGCDLVSIKF
jgi:hypothetical protein